MLAKPNRLVSAEDFRGTVRRGRRISSAGLVTYLVRRNGEGQIRFGFIVSKTVGNAVTRNRVRRRLRAASFEFLQRTRYSGADVVVRALPPAAVFSWPALRQELWKALDRQLSLLPRVQATARGDRQPDLRKI